MPTPPSPSPKASACCGSCAATRQEGVRWLGEALALPGGSPVARAGAPMWHAYFDAWFAGPAVAVVEGEAAIDVLRGAGDRLRLAEALILDDRAAQPQRRPPEVAGGDRRGAGGARRAG